MQAGCFRSSAKSSAETAIQEFHAQFDREEYSQIYRDSDSELKKKITETEFGAFLRSVHSNLGTFSKSGREDWTIRWNEHNATEVIIRLQTTFKNGQVFEYFRWRLVNQTPKLIEYRIEA
jgi:hypothetical protein